MKKLTVKIHKELGDKLKKDWQDLWLRSEKGHFFNSWSWFQACCDTESITDFQIVTCYEGKKLVALVPLVKSRLFGIRVLKNPGNKFFSEKSALLLDKKESQVIPILIKKLSELGNLYLFELDQDTVEILAESHPRILASVSAVNSYIRLENDPLRYLSKKQESKIRNKIAENRSDLQYQHHTNDLDKHLETVFEIENRSYKKMHKKDIFSKEINRGLFRSIAKHGKGFLAVDLVYYKGEPIVYNLGLNYKDRYLAFQTAYVRRYRKLSPGKILLSFMLRELQKQGKELFDFARGHNRLKQEFTPEFKLQYDIYLSKNKAVMYWFKLINLARRIKAQVTKSEYSKDGDYLFRQLKKHSKLSATSKLLYI